MADEHWPGRRRDSFAGQFDGCAAPAPLLVYRLPVTETSGSVWMLDNIKH